LHRCAEVRAGAWDNHQIAALDFVLTPATWRIGLIALRMAAPAAFVLNACRSCRTSAPEGSLERKQYGCPASADKSNLSWETSSLYQDETSVFDLRFGLERAEIS